MVEDTKAHAAHVVSLCTASWRPRPHRSSTRWGGVNLPVRYRARRFAARRRPAYGADRWRRRPSRGCAERWAERARQLFRLPPSWPALSTFFCRAHSRASSRAERRQS